MASTRPLHRHHRKKGRVAIIIRIPQHKHRRTRSLHPHWIGPNAQSVVFGQAINGFNGTITDPTVIDIASCPVSSGYATCSAEVEWPVGQYVAYAGALSGTNGTGKTLSEALGNLTVVVGGTNVVTLTLGGVIADTVVTQDKLLRGGSSSTATLSFAGYDPSGEQITGSDPFEGTTGSSCCEIFVECGALAPVTATCPSAWPYLPSYWQSPAVGDTTTVAYDGVTTFPSGTWLPRLSIDEQLTTYGGTQFFTNNFFAPVIDDGTTVSPQTLHFAGPFAAAQTITISGQPVTVGYLDGCGSATASISGSTVTVTPAADTTTACTLILSGSVYDQVAWNNEIDVPIMIGASTVPTDNAYGYASPSDLRFANASSASQTLTITPPPGYTGNIYLTGDPSDAPYQCYAMTALSANAGSTNGGSWGANGVSMDTLLSISPSPQTVVIPGQGGIAQSASVLASVNGSPVTYTIAPKAQGVCELWIRTDDPGFNPVFPVVAVGP